jgi:hypothetical protein
MLSKTEGVPCLSGCELRHIRTGYLEHGKQQNTGEKSLKKSMELHRNMSTDKQQAHFPNNAPTGKQHRNKTSYGLPCIQK